jgi:hypothetical protein
VSAPTARLLPQRTRHCPPPCPFRAFGLWGDSRAGGQRIPRFARNDSSCGVALCRRLSKAVQGSFVGSRSLCERLRCLRMTICRRMSNGRGWDIAALIPGARNDFLGESWGPTSWGEGEITPGIWGVKGGCSLRGLDRILAFVARLKPCPSLLRLGFGWDSRAGGGQRIPRFARNDSSRGFALCRRLSKAVQGSFVGSRSLCERLRCLRMTIDGGMSNGVRLRCRSFDSWCAKRFPGKVRGPTGTA